MPARDYFSDLVAPVTSVTNSENPDGDKETPEKTGMSPSSPLSPSQEEEVEDDRGSAPGGEPEAPCPACGCARFWQDCVGGWWCEGCHPFEAGEWARLVTLPEGDRPAPPEPTDEEVTAALELAGRYGWSESTLEKAFGSDWPGIAAEPKTLENMLRDVLPHPALDDIACPHCRAQAPIPASPDEPATCPSCGARVAGHAVSIARQPVEREACATCGGTDFRPDRWGTPRCRKCRPGVDG